MGHIITGKGQGRGIFIKITYMTCSVSCEQQSVVHTGVFTFLLHPGFSSITCYLPFGPVGCEM